ncbi:hypothetical protein [Sphingomonas sp.]|jgi:hypothetical protein|uniref:hypothetical protein n=1 Tax=Sphingomonas sp. TaxID=28214 RepID=UPI002ED97C3E
MGYEKAISVDITGELAEYISSAVGEYGLYEAFRAELQEAFAEPESNHRYVTAEDVIARNKLRG